MTSMRDHAQHWPPRYSGRLFEVRVGEIPGDEFGRTFEYLFRPPGVRMLVVDDQERLLLTREYRDDIGAFDIRVPGGKVVDTIEAANGLDETSLPSLVTGAADRELREEAGLTCSSWTTLHCAPAGSSIQWDLWFVRGHDPQALPGGAEPEPGEIIQPFWVPLDEAQRLAIEGSVSEDRSAMAILRLIARLA